MDAVLMRWLPTLLALIVSSAHALPPITQAEALAYHASGACSIKEAGTGLRGDGQGWIVSPYPGRTQISYGSTSRIIDMNAGQPYHLAVPPGAEVQWCVPAKIAKHDRCGTVPPALLWPAKTVTPWLDSGRVK